MAPAPGFALMGGGLWQRLRGVFTRKDAAARAEAERILIEADFGPAATDAVLDAVRDAKPEELEAALSRHVERLLAAEGDPGAVRRAAVSPTVILVFGVNGVGKTTTVAKLAHLLQRDGRSVLLAAADTFRAGAVEQLQIWADRLGVPCVGAQSGQGDPAAVAFDALAAARARGVDTLLVDTAGRIHTDTRLLDELKKIVRVIAQRHPGGDAPHEALLVLDATVGQNAVRQAEEFAAAVPLTGLVVTKLDGSAKGGAVVALRRAVNVPIRFLGTGEALDDLEPFDARAYARRLVSG
ncbi:MAG TPA: signal recognition particle-docking protein FtsY [Gemmatimonadales bacterium]